MTTRVEKKRMLNAEYDRVDTFSRILGCKTRELRSMEHISTTLDFQMILCQY